MEFRVGPHSQFLPFLVQNFWLKQQKTKNLNQLLLFLSAIGRPRIDLVFLEKYYVNFFSLSLLWDSEKFSSFRDSIFFLVFLEKIHNFGLTLLEN